MSDQDRGEARFEMPDNIIWVRPAVLKCEKCKKEEDYAGKLAAASVFFGEHAKCVASEKPRGDQLASTMTIREMMAMHLLASASGKNGTVASAIYSADLLLECLEDPSYGVSRSPT